MGNNHNKMEQVLVFQINYIIKLRSHRQNWQMQEVDIRRLQAIGNKTAKNNASQKTLINAKPISNQKNCKSLQLVSLNSQGKYQLGDKALDFLNNFSNQEFKDKQIYIFSMIGKTKTGKSFLLNELLDRDNSQQQNQTIKNQIFQVSNTLTSCTKGIQISKQFITLKSENSQKIVFFLDTQGFGSMQTTEEHEYKIFILSLLISSAIIYNSIGTIDEQTLNNFSMAIQISKIFQRKSLTQSIQSSQRKISPHLLWILRDFTLRLSNKKQQTISTNEYLQNCLKQQFESSQQKKKKRAHKQNIRRSIKQIFPKRSCETMVLPFQDDHVRQQFKSNLQKVKQAISEIVQEGECKRININSLIICLQTYISFLNEKNNEDRGNSKAIFPQIQNMMSQAKKAQQTNLLKSHHQQIKKVIQKYQTLINQYQKQNFALQTYLNKISLAKSRLIIQLQQIGKKFTNNAANNSFTKHNHQNIQFSLTDKFFFQKIDKQKEQLQGNFLNIISEKIARKIELAQSQRISRQESMNKFEECQQNILKTIQEYLINFQLSIENITNINLLQSQYSLMLQQFQLILSNQISEQEWKRHQGKISIAKYQTEIIYLRKKIVLLNQRQSQQNCIKEELLELRKQMNQLKLKNESMKLAIQGKTLSSQPEKKAIYNSEQKTKNPSRYRYQSLPQVNGYTQSTNCSKSFYVPYVNISKPEYLDVQIAKTIVKEDKKGGQYFSFDIQVELTAKKWSLGRKLKDFIQLDHILHIMFPKVELPICEYLTINSHNRLFRKTKQLQKYGEQSQYDGQVGLISQRKKQLQHYLNCLNDIQFIRNSRIFQKFIRINKDYLQSIRQQ